MRYPDLAVKSCWALVGFDASFRPKEYSAHQHCLENTEDSPPCSAASFWGPRTALLVASGLLRYPVHKFLAVALVGALGWLFLIYSLFNCFGLPATAIFGFRWIAALATMLFGGTLAAFLAARVKNRASLFGRPQDRET